MTQRILLNSKDNALKLLQKIKQLATLLTYCWNNVIFYNNQKNKDMTQRIPLNSKDNALKLIAYIHDDKAKLNELLKVWNKEDITEIAEKQRITICPVSPNETERKQIYSYLTNAPEYAKLPTAHKKRIISKYEAIPKEHIFYNDDAYDIQVRKLILNIYINEIITKATKTHKRNKTALLDELINKQTAYHTDIFTNAFKQANINTIAGKLWDLIYTDLYNDYIYEQLDEHISQIGKTELIPIETAIKKEFTKVLKWNADNNTLPTIFSEMHKAGLITGYKTDLARFLAIAFNLDYSYTYEVLKDKVNTDTGTPYIDNDIIIEVRNLVKIIQKSKKTPNLPPTQKK